VKTRVRDLIASADLGVTAVVVAGRLDLSSYVDSDLLSVRRDSAGEALGPDVLLAVAAGPQAVRHGDLEDALAALDRVDAGDHAVVLLGWPAADLSDSSVAERLATAGFVPVAAAATTYADLPVAVVVSRSGDEGAESDAAAAFRQVLTVAAADWLVDEVALLRARLSTGGDDADPVVRMAELSHERASLAASLRATELELKVAREQVAQAEASTAMRVGKALVGAAKNPRTAARLPREAVRMWRLRGGRAGLAKARTSAGVGAGLPATGGEVERLAAWRGSSLEPRTQLGLLGVVRPETEATLRRHCDVVSAKPDDAMPLLERSQPDLVLVETAVSGPSSPWAYLGNPAASERERRLLGLVDAAQGLGSPVVLWRNTPVHETAALDDLARRCDLVVDSAPARSGGTAWSVGVSLADALDLGADREARTSVVYAGGFDPRETQRRRSLLVEALEAAGGDLSIRPRRGGAGGGGFPESLRAHVGPGVTATGYSGVCRAAAVVVASPFVVPDSMLGLRDDDLLALASGARLVSGPNRDLAELPGLGSAVRVAREADVADVVRDAVADGPLSAAEHLAVLRTLVRSHTVSARLADLVRRLGLDVDVDHARRVAVLVLPGSAVDTRQLVESVLRQSLRPAEVVVARSALEQDAALYELASSGVAVRAVSMTEPTLVDLSAAADSPWITTWSPSSQVPWSDTHLLDLLIGAEAADHVDAVTLTPGGGVRCMAAFEGGATLLRRSLAVADASPAVDLTSWSRRGRTLVAVGAGS
jgi:hypothetical protein